MNLNRTLSITFMLIILSFSCITFNSCSDDDCKCTDSPSDVGFSKDIKELRQDHPYYQQVIAVFKLKQTTTEHVPSSDDCDCPATQYSTKLSITNKSDKTITLPQYSVYFTKDKFQWVYRSASPTTIAPHSSVGAGEVSVDATDISTGDFVFSVAPIEYE